MRIIVLDNEIIIEVDNYYSSILINLRTYMEVVINFFPKTGKIGEKKRSI